MVTITKKDAQPVSALDALAGIAEQLENETAQASADANGEAQPEEKPPLTNAQVVGGAIAAGRTVFCIVTKLESPKLILNDKAAQRLGDAWGPVLDKHGIDLQQYIGDYALELAAAWSTWEIVAALREAVRDEIRARAAKPVEPEAEPVATRGD